jgi:two-component system NtrC family sensor kinase
MPAPHLDPGTPAPHAADEYRVCWWDRLGVRLTAAIAVLALLTVAILLGLVVRMQERHLVDMVVSGTDVLTETIRLSTYHDMLADRRADAYQIMETVAQQPGVEVVRIFNKEGRITFSTSPGEIGRFVDKRAESCYACHAADQPIVRPNLPSRSRIFERDGHRTLGLIRPIYNETSCASASCHVHPPAQRVLGVVDVSVSLTEIDHSLEKLRAATIAIGSAAVFAFGLVITLFLRANVMSPVAGLLAATRRIASGELSCQVPVQSRGELAALERAFNDMARSLARARAERLELLESLERQVEERTAELRRAQAQLVQSEKLSSLGRLAASIAHEINNPLAGILTYAKLLIRTFEHSPDPQVAAALKQLRLVQRETERCSAIVRNLLDFARERPLTLKDISVNQVVEEALVLVANQARLSNIAIEKRLGAVPPVRADFGQIRQALINLIINACDAMPQGGRLTVETAADEAAGVVEVRIGDTGCGIPADVLPRVLDPFFTTKDKGTGLGLSVVYGIVERHGGSLDIASQVGMGTTVTIRLPAAPATAAAPRAGAAASSA